MGMRAWVAFRLFLLSWVVWLLDCSGQSAIMLFLSTRRERKPQTVSMAPWLDDLVATATALLEVSRHGQATVLHDGEITPPCRHGAVFCGRKEISQSLSLDCKIVRYSSLPREQPLVLGQRMAFIVDCC